MKRRRVYGPVPSRRFGLSLGVDVVPPKTCCLDCIYCQVGRTTRLTCQREDFFPLEEVLADLHQALSDGPRPDVITFAGSGEPTLYRSLGPLIQALCKETGLPVLLLTNGALLADPRIREAAQAATILSPSLDAPDPATFERINQPHPSIRFEDMVEGLRLTCGQHQGTLRLEVMLVKGLNDSPAHLAQFAALLKTLRVESFDINTPVRPMGQSLVGPCDPQTLEAARVAFGDRAVIIGGYDGRQVGGGETGGDVRRSILSTLSRRPSTLQDLQSALGLSPRVIEEVIDRALQEKILESREGKAGTYFFCRALPE